MTTQQNNIHHRIWYKLMEDVVFLVPEGAGDESCAEELQLIIDDLCREGHRSFVLDLSHLKYVETPGFRLIVNKLCELQKIGGSLVVTGLKGVVARAFDLLKLDKFVPVAADAASAIGLARSIQGPQPAAT